MPREQQHAAAGSLPRSPLTSPPGRSTPCVLQHSALMRQPLVVSATSVSP